MIVKDTVNHRFFANFKKYRFLLDQLVRRDIKIKYRRSVLGIFWSFLEPLLSMIVLSIVFSTFFKHSISNYPVYYLTGLLVYQFFAGGSNAAMRSIKSSASILKTIYIPKYMYSLSAILSNFITFLLSLIVLFLVMLATHATFTIYILFAVLPIIALLFLTIGVGLILATVNVFFRDMEHLYGVCLQLLMYAMPIMYPANIVPASFRFIQYYNPLYAVISCCRSVFLYGTIYNPLDLLFAMVSGVALLIIGIAMFYKYQDRFILYV
ncbi:MAG: ABC transporter permease [Methanobacterium paludis]|nr:ABC transporter permease [Methanobacterium paludis]